jgi:hypothetical protein
MKMAWVCTYDPPLNEHQMDLIGHLQPQHAPFNNVPALPAAHWYA